MPITEIDIQLIEKHLDKSLSESEQAVFSQRLADADFVTELALYQKSIYAIHAAGDKKLKSMLILEESMLQAPPQYSNVFIPDDSPRLIKQMWWAMAAAFLIIVGVGYVFLTRSNEIKQGNKDRLFAANFQAYHSKADEPDRGENDVRNEERDTAYILYDAKNYRGALTYFEKVKSPSSYMQFLQANAYLALNEIDKAIPILKKISQDTSAKKQQAAEWYLALALSETQPEEAKRLFERIKSTAGHGYQNDAIDILKKQ